MTLKFNDYEPPPPPEVGGVNSPWGHMWAWSSGFVDICCQFSAQDVDEGLDCFCSFIAESLRKRPQGFVTVYAPSRIGWGRE